MVKKALTIIAALCMISGKAQTKTDKAPAPKDVNIAPCATVTSNPYCGTLQYLTDGEIPAGKSGKKLEGPFYEEVEAQSDGSIATFACFPVKSSKQAIFFKFASPVPIKKIRLYQRKAHSKSFIVEGDSDGDGNYETILGKSEGAPDAWSEIKLEKPLIMKSLRFASLKNSGRAAPQIAEFQIFSTQESLVLLDSSKEEKNNPDAIELKFKKPENFPKKANLPEKDKYQFGACCCLWMFVNYNEPYKKENKINQYALKSMKELDLNRMKLFVNLRPKSIEKVKFPTDPTYLSRIYPSDINKSKRYKGIAYDCAPWPSEVLISYKENILARVLKEVKEAGIEASIMPPRNGPPFDVRPGCYPMAQADCHDKRPDPRFPCVWHGGYWKPAFKKILNEIANCGSKGVEVVPDEFYVEGHNLRKMPKNDPCRKLFKEKYGIDVPKSQSDSEAYRKWVLFQYDSTAETFADFVDSVKKHRPGIHTETNLSVAPLIFYGSPGFTLAFDIVGHKGKYDSFGTDPYYRTDTLGHYQMPKTCEIFKGATPSRNTSMLLQTVCGDWTTPLKDPVWAAGNATSVLMRGVHEIDFYRLNYFAPIGERFEKNKAFHFIKNWIKMIRALEACGIKHAKPPKDVAFVYSRAGTDWWELKELMKERKKPGKKYAYPNSAMAGYSHHDAVMEILMKNGQLFDLYYLDQPSTLKNALDYKVIVLPFPYSVSDESLEILRKAHANGSGLLIIGKKGETDEFGNKRKIPALNEFIGKPGVEFLEIDMLKEGNSPETKKKVLAAVDKLLGKNKTFFVDTKGKDVETGLLRNGKFIFIPVINWHNKPVKINIGVKLPEGNYQLEKYSLAGVSKGEAKLSAKDMMNLSLEMPAHDTCIIVAGPAE